MVGRGPGFGLGRVLTPLLLGFSHTFDKKSGLTLEFSNKFTNNNENDRLVDLLEQSVSMGKKLDLSRETYAAFVDSHANTAIHDFMNGALDVAKNMVMSSVNQAITWDENGLRLRKWADDSKTSYDPHQVWMMNENIVFTNDDWQTAKMAIGHIVDDKLGDLWGVVADNLVGKMIAGESMYIYSTKPDGEHMSFTVDGSGVTTYNSHQQWIKPTSETGKFNIGIVIDPKYGLFMNDGTHPLYKNVAGADPVPYCCDIRKNELTLKDGVPEGMNVWIGVDGKLYIKGNIYAIDGIFSGLLEATEIKAATITGTIESDDNGKIVGPEICAPDEYDPKFHVYSEGNTTITGGVFEAPTIMGEKIEVTVPKTTNDKDTGFILSGKVGGNLTYQFLRVYTTDDYGPAYTIFRSPAGTTARWEFPRTEFTENVHFSGNVTGLHLTLA